MSQPYDSFSFLFLGTNYKRTAFSLKKIYIYGNPCGSHKPLTICTHTPTHKHDHTSVSTKIIVILHRKSQAIKTETRKQQDYDTCVSMITMLVQAICTGCTANNVVGSVIN